MMKLNTFLIKNQNRPATAPADTGGEGGGVSSPFKPCIILININMEFGVYVCVWGGGGSRVGAGVTKQFFNFVGQFRIK